MTRIITYTITSQYDGLRIDSFLKEMGYNHQTIVYIKQTERGILKNQVWVYVRDILKTGDILTIQWEEPVTSSEILPVELPLSICYEDEDILVIDKPCNMPVHPSMGNHDNTLANAVLYYYASQNKAFTYRCVNRLDRDTTGLTIIAKNCLSAGFLSRAVSNRDIHRTYLAIVEGHITEKGTIQAPISRKSDSTIERIVDFENGEHAVTHFSPVAYNKNKDLSLIKLQLETGRTHQIRVHMKYYGHPLIGDFLYNPNKRDITRQALHSYKLCFLHPVSLMPLTFTAPLPADMATLFPHIEID